jgi:hypothetical protein
LQSYHPILKLLSIKSVVFFAFWQQVGIAILFYYSMIPSIGSRTEVEVGSAINSFLICIEMFVLSITNFFVFSYKPYKPDVRLKRRATESFRFAVKNFATKVVNQKDIFTDVKKAFGKKGAEEAILCEMTPLVSRPVVVLDLDEFMSGHTDSDQVDREELDPFLIYSPRKNSNITTKYL